MKKKILLFLAFAWFIISFLIIHSTYAKYLSTLDSNANIGISGWNILLNNQDILQNSDISQNINLIFPGDSYYNANLIVPGVMRIF